MRISAAGDCLKSDTICYVLHILWSTVSVYDLLEWPLVCMTHTIFIYFFNKTYFQKLIQCRPCPVKYEWLWIVTVDCWSTLLTRWISVKSYTTHSRPNRLHKRECNAVTRSVCNLSICKEYGFMWLINHSWCRQTHQRAAHHAVHIKTGQLSVINKMIDRLS